MKKHCLYAVIIALPVLLTAFGCYRAFRYSMGCAEIRSGQSFSFFITNDLHHLSKSTYDNGTAFAAFLTTAGGKLVKYSGEMLETLEKEIELASPDFLIINGDMTCNGDRESHLELVQMLESIERSGTCAFVVPGNHDILNPCSQRFTGEMSIKSDGITYEEFRNIYARFGYDDAISRDADSLSYLAMPAEDVWLLMLDSTHSQLNAGRQYPELGGSLTPDTLKWIEQCGELARENKARLIAIMHHSLLDHSPIIHMDYTIKDNDELLKVFEKCGIDIVLTGHVHIQDIKTQQSGAQKLYDLATSSLAVYPHQYGRMNFVPGKGLYYRTVKLDNRYWTERVQATGESLPDIEAYSVHAFIEQCCKQYDNFKLDLKTLSEEDKDKVCDTIARMNLLYFAGFRNEALDDIVESEGYKLLESLPSCFTKDYVSAMLKDERKDNNTLFVPFYSSEK